MKAISRIIGVLLYLLMGAGYDGFGQCTASKQPVVIISCPKTEGVAVPSVSRVNTILASTQTREIKPYVEQFVQKKLFDKEVLPGKVIKQVENPELGATEWILSNGMRVVVKNTNFRNDEIQFRGLRNKSITSLKKEYFYTAFWGGDILSEMGLSNFNSTRLKQVLAGKNVSVEPSFFPKGIDVRATEQFIKGHSAPKDFETCLQLIHMNFCNQRWDATVLANKVKLLKEKMCGLSPMSAFSDSVAFYTRQGQARQKDKELSYEENLNLISIEKLKKIHNVIFGDPAKITFFFSGNLKPEEAKPLIEKYLGGIAPDSIIESGEDMIDTTLINNSPKDYWKIGRKSMTFKYPMQTPGALACITLNGKHDGQPSNYLYGQMTWKLLVDECQDYVRGKSGTAYPMSSAVSYNATDNILDLSLYYQTNTNVAEKIRKGTVECVKNFLIAGPNENNFKSLKNRIVSERTNDLKSNRWWVDKALYEYYFHGKNILPSYCEEVKNITRKDLTLYIQNVYNQGENLADALMLPK